MIIDNIIAFFLNIGLNLFSFLPSFEFSIPNGIFVPLNSLVASLGFIFPVSALMPILFASFGLSSFHIIWNIIIRVKSFIPTMGS